MLNKLLIRLSILTAEWKLKKASLRRERLDNEYRRYAIRDTNSTQVRHLGNQAKMAISEELELQNHLQDLKRRQ